MHILKIITFKLLQQLFFIENSSKILNLIKVHIFQHDEEFKLTNIGRCAFF